MEALSGERLEMIEGSGVVVEGKGEADGRVGPERAVKPGGSADTTVGISG